MVEEIRHRYDKLDKQYIDLLPGIRVKHVEHFSAKMLYFLMREWLIEEDWTTRGDDSSFQEELYLHYENAQIGDEIWFWWRFEKTPPDRSTYYKYLLDIDVHILALKPAEILHKGTKYKADFGDCEVRLWGKIMSDQAGTWKKHAVLKHFQKLFWKRIYKKNFEMHKRELYSELYRFQEAIKTYFTVTNFLPEQEGQPGFWPQDKVPAP